MKICYFGIFNPEFGRNKIYIEAFRNEGHEIIVCNDNTLGLLKYLKLWRKHKKIKDDYDFMIVGYPGHIIVPLAKMISNGPVLVDALGSLYDAEVYSHKPGTLRKLKSRIADWLMLRFADKILLETEAQKQYFEAKFGISNKFEVVYTGAALMFVSDEIMSHVYSEDFGVLFRGKLTPESGIMHILKAAKLLKDNLHVHFKIIGGGYLLKEAEKFIRDFNLINVSLESQYLSSEELVQSIKDSDLMLGQFEDNPRLNRTIPHKAFEAFAMGVPYLTADASGVREVVEDGISGFLVQVANPEALADKIRALASESYVLTEAAARARRMFNERFSSKVLVRRIIEIVLQYRDGKN